MTQHRIMAAHNAMATRFEMVLHGRDPVALRAAADQGFQEIDRLHRQLSLYSPSSEISHINARAAGRAMPVEPGLFALLQLAKRIHQETDGAFDVTVAPLIRSWGFMGGPGSLPNDEILKEALAKVGMHNVILDERHRTVQFAREGVMLDLGSIGKGYALDVAMEVLIDAGVESALIHGGTSTVCAIGNPPEEASWKVAVDRPPHLGATDRPDPTNRSTPTNSGPLAVVELTNESLSVSGVHGKSFRVGTSTYGHVIDPRTGWPVAGALLAAVVLPSATESDAYSTALLVSGAESQVKLRQNHAGMRTLVAEADRDRDQLRVSAQGIAPLN